MAASAAEIVLLPGLDGTGDLFARLSPLLAEQLTVSTVRYPNDPMLGYAGCAELARKMIGQRQVFVLGESFSGPVAVMVAKQLRDQIRGIVLAATFVENPWPGWIIRAAARARPQHIPRKMRDAILMGSFGDPELSSKVDEITRALPRPVRAARLRAVAEVDVRPDFAALRCPILVLHGRGDWLVPKTSIQNAIATKGGARMIVVPAAHMLLQTCAPAAAGEIAYFVKSSSEARYDS
jgi:pimeloyl-ACP methyl ester carboxylesterase